MSELYTYTYIVLRYVHDTTTGEFVNVGVALHAPKLRYASAVCRTTAGRLSALFPGMNVAHFKSLMRHIQARFEEMGEQMGTQLDLEPATTVRDLASQILPPDDGSLQWSPMGTGRTTDPAAELERLFERMVSRFDSRQERERRTEEDVWRHFKRKLEARQLLHHFSPRTITTPDDELEFRYTWKNGILHCLEPVSFDLSSAETIRDKAYRWLGRLTSVAESREKFRVYFLVGEPNEAQLETAFENALRILNKIPVETAIVREQQVEEFSDRLANEVAAHEVGGEH